MDMKRVLHKPIVWLFFVFILMFILNLFTPMLLDDYSYSLTFDRSRRIHNLIDIVQFLSIHYYRWGGRVLAHFIAQVFLLFPRWIFSVFNSLIFVVEGLLIYCIVRIQNGKKKKDQYLFLLLIYLLLWFCNPIFGQINFWLIGSCNYLWTMVIMLFYVYLLLSHHSGKWNTLLLLLFGLLAGMCNENTSLAIIGMSFLISLFDKKNRKIICLSVLFCLFGYLFLMIAPGNSARMVSTSNSSFSILSLFQIAHFQFRNIYCYFLIPFLAFSVLVFLAWKKYKIKEILYYYVGLLISFFSLLGSPVILLRYFYSSIIFMILIIIAILWNLKKESIIQKGIIVLLCFFSVHYSLCVVDFYHYSSFYHKRENAILEAVSKKKDVVYLSIYDSNNSKIPTYLDLDDLSTDYDSFPNNYMEKYYGISKIIGY